MSGAFTSAGLFLINTLFDLYLIILIVRLLLAWVHADYSNPLTQIVVKFTQPLIKPLRRFIPNYAGIELSTILVIFLVEIVKFLLLALVAYGMPTHFSGLGILAIADMLKLFLNTFFYAILLQAILSWVQPGYSPIARVLMQITSPIMRPIQRVVPPVGGFDVSPIPALIILQLLIILLVTPLFEAGLRMTFM